MHRRPPPQRAQRRRRAVAPPPRLSPLKSVARARICIGVWCGIETEQLVSCSAWRHQRNSWAVPRQQAASSASGCSVSNSLSRLLFAATPQNAVTLKQINAASADNGGGPHCFAAGAPTLCKGGAPPQRSRAAQHPCLCWIHLQQRAAEFQELVRNVGAVGGGWATGYSFRLQH